MRNLTEDEVHKLGDQELREELEARGTPVGPISDFMRPMLVKILLRKFGLHGDAQEDGARGDGWSSQVVEADPMAGADLDAPPVYAFFGVHLPPNCCESHAPDSDLAPVYTDKIKCLAALKKHKGSRFKTFASYDEALQFSELGPKFSQNGCTPDSVNDGECVDGNTAKTAVSLSLEKPCAFKGPTSQDRVLFRKIIERGDIAAFNEYVERNPRYLVSSSDSPAILKEGSRYNALHVACLAGHHHICAQILRCISDERLFHRLYPDDTPSTSARRQQYLLDLYLNMPDKGINETPLHIACKHAHTACVKVLISYAQCDKQRRNKYGETPFDVISQRASRSTCSSSSPASARAAIEELLEPQFYVPVLRDSSFTQPPVVGRVLSPTTASQQEFAGDMTSSSFAFLNVTGGDSLANVSSLECSVEHEQRTTPRLHSVVLPSPLSCFRKVEAFLGPLPLSKALSVRRQWLNSSRPTPPLSVSRLDSSNLDDSSPILPLGPACRSGAHSTPKRGGSWDTRANSDLQTPPLPASDAGVMASTPRHREVALPDYEKGLEVVGRRLAQEYNTSWFEYWDFLGEFVDCRSDEGKAKLEEHLKAQYAKVITEEQLLSSDEMFSKLDDEGVVVSGGPTTDGGDTDRHTPVSASSASGRVTVVMAPGVIGTTVESPIENKEANKNRSSSSLGSLCRGLEAIRLNASLSPNPSHYSPAAQRRYDELLEIMQEDESRLRDVITSIDTSHLNLTADHLNASLRSDNWRLISYVAQSCRVTARALGCVMQDMVLDLHHKMVPQLALVRMVKAKMAGEVLALHVLISRCCADDRKKKSSKKEKRSTRKADIEGDIGSKNESDFINGNLDESLSVPNAENNSCVQARLLDNSFHASNDGEVNGGSSNASALEKSIRESGVTFIHGLVAVEMVRQLSENLLPSELLSLVKILRIVVENSSYLEIASSDEDDEECDDRRGFHRREVAKSSNGSDHAQHVKCVVLLLERALAIATKEGTEDNCCRIPAVAELPHCSCHWDNCCSTLAALTEYAFRGSSSINKKCRDSGVVTKNARNRSSVSACNNSMNTSKIKYSKAHSFLHQTVYGNSSPSSFTPRRSPRLNKVPTEEIRELVSDTKQNVVKTLNFDEENNLMRDKSENEEDKNNSINDNGSPKLDSINANKRVGNEQQFSPTDHRENIVMNNSISFAENTGGDGAPSYESNEDSGHVNDEGEVDDEDTDSFATAASTSVTSSLATPDEAREIFINGTTPSKVDLDVLRALGGANAADAESLEETPAVDETRFPHLAQWQQLLQEKLRSQTSPNSSVRTSANNVTQKSLFESPYCPKPRRRLQPLPPTFSSL
ncbi:Ankyrin repeat-containing domain [Trinorchestia longiramus]|nr:Ankyrin repeat-containing domain [Trinorchestia longiramus]